MTTMVEKVARAICQSQTQSMQVWQSFVPEALAALKAMREPTRGMVDAAYDAHEKFEAADEGTWGGAGAAYRAMIDAAIAEHEGRE